MFLLFLIYVVVIFLSLFKSNRCEFRKLILKFVDDESGLHHGYVVVNYNKMNLYLVDNILVVQFYGRLL